jgi:hypothetical protein
MQVAVGIDGETLVKDDRLEKVFYTLQRLVKYPDGLQFRTQMQEPSEQEKRRLAVFMVLSPHPRQKNERLITMAATTYENWQETNRQYRHYAGLADPLRPIFAGLLRQHLMQRENLEALEDAPAKTYGNSEIVTLGDAISDMKD